MALKINQHLVTKESAEQLIPLCPFGAIHYENNELQVSGACKLCRLCIKNGPQGVMEWQEEKVQGIDKSLWKGIAVYIENGIDGIHPVSLELIGKALELSSVTHQPVYALLIGNHIESCAETVLTYGVDAVYTYDNQVFEYFTMTPYANAFLDFIEKVHPSSILVGATAIGRSLAPKVASRLRTGLTADCTILEMKENTDLVQIRPAFGGNIMAQIITPNHRPQFATVRYKIFTAPEQCIAHGTIIPCELKTNQLNGKTEVLECIHKPKEMDISDAEVIVAVGRGIKKKEDLEIIQAFANMIHAELACTRPIVEAGWMDAKKQIGLSGRTVKAKLLIAIGISGAVQFTAGMRACEKIIAINEDKEAPIFDVAHICVHGNLYDIIPAIINMPKEIKHV